MVQNAMLRKAIFPVAGLGTRFLPATKANPKEMLPVVDKPLIQYAVEEAIEAGATELVFITGRNKNAIMDHFDKSYELENELLRANKLKMLELTQNILPNNATCSFIRQPEARGLGHAVGCAGSTMSDEFFAVLLADDLIDGMGQGALAQMVAIHQEFGCSVIAVERVPDSITHQYGIVECDPIRPKISRIKSIIEKPKQGTAPSNLAVVGRYILSPHIFRLIQNVEVGSGGEIQLTDAIAKLLLEEPVIAYEFTGKRYDCGSKLGFLQANVAYALKHPELGEDFKNYLKNMND